MTNHVAVSVIIPTHNRIADLQRCLDALRDQQAEDVEIVVVDDGSSPPVATVLAETGPAVRVLRVDGAGPAAARNAGAKSARGEILLFTDDDTIPDCGWIAAAREELSAHRDAVAVEGVIVTKPYDPLYEYSIESSTGGHYWTANIAYRRSAFEQLGGFAEDVFPYPHCEDRDLGLRAAASGEIRFRSDMIVEHVPRRMSLSDFRRRGKFAASELVLVARHPELARSSRFGRAVAPIRAAASYWRGVMRLEGTDVHANRLPRLFAVAATQLVAAAASCIVTQRRFRQARPG